LANARVQLLEGIGFEWNTMLPWGDRFNKLKAHKAFDGDCNAPQGCEENPPL
jgi:hypothetical protein